VTTSNVSNSDRKDPSASDPRYAPLKVLLIGGNSVLPAERGYRTTPETTLEAGLIDRGFRVDTRTHGWDIGRRRWDIVHVHHLAHQALVQPLFKSGSRLVFTRHATRDLPFGRRKILDLIYLRSDAVVVLSESERSTVLRHVPVDRISCIPNGIDANQWAYRERESPGTGNPWRILFVGQLAPVKNVDVLLRSVARIDKGFQVQVELVYQVNSQEQQLRALASELGIADRVQFKGKLDQGSLKDVYGQSHVLVLPSRSEGLPSVVTEAILSGVPVIATTVGGIPEQLDEQGTLVPPGDVEALRRAIEGVFKAYPDAAKKASAAAQSARKRYSVDSMVDAHIDLYEGVLRRNPRKLMERV